MDKLPRRSALTAGAALASTSCVGVSDEAIPAMGDDQATITAWIERHRDNLPTDYDALGLLPFPYRREVAEHLSSVQKSALIQEHLRRAIEARPALTEEQRAVIDLARAAMTPAWFEATPEERQVWGTRWGHRLGTAFDPGEQVRIFGSIGPEDEAIRRMISKASLPRSSGPVTYDEIASLSREEQQAVFSAAYPDDMASIYRGYFEHLAAREGLTAEQRVALQKAAALVSPAWYEPGESATREEVERLLRGAFGGDAAHVMSIGSE